MARNMIEANRALFNKFRFRHARFNNDNTQRYIFSNELEKCWLKNVEVQSHQELIFSEFQSAHICRLNDEIYLLTKNIASLENEDLTPYEINGGLFVAVANELSISIKIEVSEEAIEEIPMRERLDDEKRVGFDLSEIMPFFDNLRLYKFAKNSPLLEDSKMYRLALFIVLQPSTKLCRLRLRSASLTQFGFALHDDVENFPISLLYLATQERRWDIAFLNIYKSLEQLFPLFKIEDFRNGYDKHLSINDSSESISSSVTLFDLASLAENHLGWRAHEEEAMQRLFSKLPDQLIEEFSHYLGVTDNSDKRIGKVAEAIYKIRNCTVHFRPGNLILKNLYSPSMTTTGNLYCAHF